MLWQQSVWSSLWKCSASSSWRKKRICAHVTWSQCKRLRRRCGKCRIIVELQTWKWSKKQARTEHVDLTPRIAQLEGDFHALKGRLGFRELCNIVSVFWNSLLVDEHDLLKCRIASGGFCCVEMVQLLASHSNDVYALIDDLNHHIAHVLKAVQIKFCSKSDIIADHLQMFFQKDAATFS